MSLLISPDRSSEQKGSEVTSGPGDQFALRKCGAPTVETHGSKDFGICPKGDRADSYVLSLHARAHEQC